MSKVLYDDVSVFFQKLDQSYQIARQVSQLGIAMRIIFSKLEAYRFVNASTIDDDHDRTSESLPSGFEACLNSIPVRYVARVEDCNSPCDPVTAC